MRDAFCLTKTDLSSFEEKTAEVVRGGTVSITRAAHRRGRSMVDVINLSVYHGNNQIGWVTVTERQGQGGPGVLPKLSVDIFSPHEGKSGERSLLIMEQALSRFGSLCSERLMHLRTLNMRVIDAVNACLSHPDANALRDASHVSASRHRATVAEFMKSGLNRFLGLDVVLDDGPAKASVMLCAHGVPISGAVISYDDASVLIRTNPGIGLSRPASEGMERVTRALVSRILSADPDEVPSPQLG